MERISVADINNNGQMAGTGIINGRRRAVLIETSTSLLDRYSPILHLFEDDFRPKDIDSILTTSDLVIGPISDPISPPSRDDLAAGHSVTSFLDIQDASGGWFPCGIGTNCPDPSDFSDFDTAIYGREIDVRVGEFKFANLNLDQTNPDTMVPVLQYWFFYPYNNWSPPGVREIGNRHEGDWEMIQLIIDPDTSEPIHATYSWHLAGTTYDWEELQLDGDHPHVYITKGGHGSWAEGGDNKFWTITQPFSNFVGTDRTPRKDAGIKLHQSGTVCEDECESYKLLTMPEGEWNNFMGRWGEVPFFTGSLGTAGPPSPKFINYFGNERFGRWFDPLTWADDPEPLGWVSILRSPPLRLKSSVLEGSK